MVRAGEAGGALEQRARAARRLPGEPGAPAKQGLLDPDLPHRDVRLRAARGGCARDGGAASDHRPADYPRTNPFPSTRAGSSRWRTSRATSGGPSAWPGSL